MHAQAAGPRPSEPRQMSKMFISGQLPQSVWFDPPKYPIFATQSQVDSYSQRAIVQSQNFEQRLFDFCYNNISACPLVLSQPRTQQQQHNSQQFQYYPQSWTMEEKHWFDQIMDRSNNSYMDERSYNTYLPGTGLEDPNTRQQTTPAYVSAPTAGRDLNQSHFQQNKETETGGDPMIWSSPSITPANAYQPYLGGFGGSPNHTSSWQSYEGTSADTNQFENCFFHDGLPDSSCVPSSPHALGEPPVCNRISPTTTYSSFSSSAPTEAMGSLSFDTINETMGTPGSPRMNNDAAGPPYYYPATISPAQLRKVVTPTPNSSSESVHTALQTSDNPDSTSSNFDRLRRRSPLPSKHQSGKKSRRELPTKPTKPRRGHLDTSADRVAFRAPQSSSRHHDTSPQPKLAPLRPKPEKPFVPPVAVPAPIGSSGGSAGMFPGQVPNRWSDKDDFLVRSKEAGMTYREIRKQGNFKEAESTLRGRYRTLTKSKEARVRKPEWQDKDIHLLKKAVHEFARGNEIVSAKIPWKEVAKYIVKHGGSYHFGNATCRKRWDDLVALQGDEA